jgi:hypothetical protein
MERLKEWGAALVVMLPALLAVWKEPGRWELILGLAVVALLFIHIRGQEKRHQACEARCDVLVAKIERMQSTMAEFYRAVQDTRGNRDVDFPDFGDILSGKAVFRWDRRPVAGGKRRTDPPA